MGRVLTNNVSLAYTIETALGVAGTDWFLLEPNDITTFGATITTVARDPISRNRQRRKGTVTDLDSTAEFEEDLALSSFRDFIEGYCFSTGINTDVTDLTTTAATAVGPTYTITALDAAQADKFEIGSLIYVVNFATAQNNGLKSIAVDAVATDTTLTINEALVDETAPGNARISFAGQRFAVSTVTWDYDAPNNQATLNGTGAGTLATQLGLTPGEFVHIGSPDGSGGFTNAFENVSANDMFGYARVVSVSTDDIVFDKLDEALKFDDAVAPTTLVDMLFGQFVRNVPTSSADFLERSFQFEGDFPNLGTAGASKFQYSKGNFCNTAGFNLPGQDKATVSYGFIGTDTDNPVEVGDRKPGADSAADPIHVVAYNTTNDIARLRITDVDEAGLTTDFKSLTITLNNNVSPEKVLGVLGAKFINTGNFEVDIEAQLVFTNSEVIDRIRDNTTVTMEVFVDNDDGVIILDIPSMTLGGGDYEFPVNESVLLNTTAQAFLDSTLGTSIGVSIIPVPLG